MITKVFRMSLSGEDVGEVLVGLRASGLFPGGDPDTIEHGVKTRPAGEDWFEVAQRKGGTFNFGEGHTFLWVRQPDLVSVSLEDFAFEPSDVARRLDMVPFEVASLSAIHLGWAAGTLGEAYHGPSFGGLHSPFGWGCAFHGAGHQRVVSRRWLETGPWQVIASGDTTLIQFHAMGIDPAAALAEARIGHKRMVEGILPAEDPGDLELEGLYSKKQRKLIITAPGRSLDAKALRTAAMVRRFQSLGAKKPVDNIVYVFIDAAEADRHKDTLQLYGFEVRLIGDDGQERLIE